MTKSTINTKIISKLQHTPEGAALSALILAVFRNNGRLLRAGDALAGDLLLTSTRWQVLGAIAGSPRTVAQIARVYEMSRQGVLWVTQSMLKSGLIELIDNPDHRRAKLVRQTKRGQAIYNEIMRRQVAWANQLGRSFRAVELKRCMDTLERLGGLIRNGEGSDEPRDS